MESYISCIKIRGTSILPPLMTDDMRVEMRHYKQLALSVEDKLSRRKLTFSEEEKSLEHLCLNKQKTNEDKRSEGLSRQESFVSSEIDSSEHTLSRLSGNKNDFYILDNTSKAASDDDTLTRSTDLHRYINTSDSSKTDTIETISDAGKPAVPRTLNIIPITVGPIVINNKNKLLPESDESDAPKLVRQGSYTLDSPSPMLLAHLDQTVTNDYKPISSKDETNKLGRNIAEGKTEWKNKEYDKNGYLSEKCYQDNEKKFKIRRNSISGSASKCEKSDSDNIKTDKHLAGINHVARSVDCIQAMLAKDFVCGMANYGKNEHECYERIQANSGEAKIDNNWKTTKDTSTIKLTRKLGGSLGSLINGKSSNKSEANNRMTRSFEVASNIDNCNGHNISEVKPIAADKLLYVFREIQKTHQRQMADLMARQQREQMMMQHEFEKQQLILLEQLEKTYPGISMPAIVNKIVNAVNNKEQMKNNITSSISLPKFYQNRSDAEMSPFNSSSFESEDSISINCGSIKDNMASESRAGRKPSVYRKLFPDDKYTTSSFITNGLIYNIKQIKAATIINAYARGYLVRRLMKTERVMSLKNTYREALHCMLKLHVDAPWKLPELNFHKRLQLQCDAASVNIVELFAQSPAEKMEIISQDRQIKKTRQGRPVSAKSSYSFATQRTLARKKFKELGIFQLPDTARANYNSRTRCQTWTSNSREKRSPLINQGIKRSTSAGAVRKPWR